MEFPVIVKRTASAGGCASTGRGAGTAPDALAHLPEHIRARVRNHPCYSADAHHHFARMHVAVAPACNIQCNYCNRKYDCANESRPGVVSELLTPEQAVRKVLAVAAEIPQMTVLGIAGPGDPLANPRRTFETFRRLAEQAPDLKLCLSTNGLELPRHLDEIARYNIEHVTVTINAVDPEIAARIHPWIHWRNRRVRGLEAARILIDRQQKSLDLLQARGILVKINSVVIPGVNDEHLREVSRVVKSRGAFLHNLMPLIAEAAHGTYYGLMGQPEPTAAQLEALREDCSGDMAIMRHCRQCRADAVGMLGEDRNAEFSMARIDTLEVDYAAALVRRRAVQAEIVARLDAQREATGAAAAGAPMAGVGIPVAMPGLRGSASRAAAAVPATLGSRSSAASKARTPAAPDRRAGAPALADFPADARPVLMAVAARDGLVGEHFGRAEEFLIYEASPRGARLVGRRRIDPYCAGPEHCEPGHPEAAGDNGASDLLDYIVGALAGCEAVLCSRIGYEPWGRLEAAGIMPNGEHAMAPVETAVLAVYRDMAAAGRLRARASAQAMPIRRAA